jgi:hypothetical protein
VPGTGPPCEIGERVERHHVKNRHSESEEAAQKLGRIVEQMPLLRRRLAERLNVQRCELLVKRLPMVNEVLVE